MAKKALPRKRVRCTSSAARELFDLVRPKFRVPEPAIPPSPRDPINTSRECARRRRQAMRNPRDEAA